MNVPTDVIEGAADPTSPWLAGAYEPVPDELDADDLVVNGRLPAGLRGTFLRNGPNVAFAPVGRYHVFDGDGMLHGLSFDGEGGVSYRNRWVRSRGLAAERAAGHALYGGLSEYSLPSAEVIAEYGLMKNTANTHVVRHAGRVLALMEACPPTEVTEQCETMGEYDFGGALAGPMTAHPKIDPVTGEMVFFGYSPLAPYLRVHSASADGRLTWSTEIELPGPVMMHDFVVTASRVIVFDLPASFELSSLLAGGPAFRWAPELGARIGVLDRGAPGDSIRWIEVDPFWVFHFLNAYDESGPDGPIVVHGCRTPRINAGFEDTDRAESAHPMLHRWRIDPAAGSVTDEQLDDRPGDFPRIDDRRAGLAARYGYVARVGHIEGTEIAFDGLIKHDLERGTSESFGYDPGGRVVCGEPVFTHDPGQEAEDAGWILNWVHDLNADQSAMVILDAGTLDEVARVHPPRRVPLGFHGSFLPASG